MAQLNTQSLLPRLREGDKYHIVVVCHGNMYRSPLCAAWLDYELRGIAEVRSRGVKVGCDNHITAAKIRRYAVDPINNCPKEIVDHLTAHKSAYLQETDLLWAHLVVYMDSGNKRRLDQYRSIKFPNLVCLAEYSNGEATRIADPAFLPTAGSELQKVLDLIGTASRRLAASIRLGSG